MIVIWNRNIILKFFCWHEFLQAEHYQSFVSLQCAYFQILDLYFRMK